MVLIPQYQTGWEGCRGRRGEADGLSESSGWGLAPLPLTVYSSIYSLVAGYGPASATHGEQGTALVIKELRVLSLEPSPCNPSPLEQIHTHTCAHMCIYTHTRIHTLIHT